MKTCHTFFKQGSAFTKQSHAENRLYSHVETIYFKAKTNTSKAFSTALKLIFDKGIKIKGLSKFGFHRICVEGCV
jgi:phosphopantetheine adenylyltransferase